MSANRLQKLLFTEYNEFEDMVLIESPFAQTTREGHGIRQVQMGLTPSKLILASDVLQPESPPVRSIDVDPDIESLEMISMFPVEFVNISVYQRRTRRTLKARFCNGQILYFELAGSYKRDMFWNLWCERVKFLNPEETKTTASETSVATSGLTELSSGLKVNSRSINTIHHDLLLLDSLSDNLDLGDSLRNNPILSWQDKNLFLGPEFYSGHMIPSAWSIEKEILDQCSTSSITKCFSQMPRTNSSKSAASENKMHLVHRFGCGIEENCQANLFLPVIPELPGPQISQEEGEFGTSSAYKDKFKLDTDFIPFPLYLNGVGLVETGGAIQFQALPQKRVSSEVSLRIFDKDLETTASKFNPSSSVSCHSIFNSTNSWAESSNSSYWTGKASLPLFLTRGLSVPHCSASSAYVELQEHMRNERNGGKLSKSWTRKGSSMNKTMSKTEIEFACGDYTKESVVAAASELQTNNLETFGCENLAEEAYSPGQAVDTYSRFTGWEFDSTTLAYQITLIDKELFLKISPVEVVTIVHEKSLKNAPNFAAVILFSHRLINLITTLIVSLTDVQERGRMVARMIHVSEKLHRLRNFHSVRTMIAALESAPVFRLSTTWRYLKQHHSTKYQRFMHLTRLHADPRTMAYQKLLKKSLKTHPFLPAMDYILAALLGKLPPPVDLKGHLDQDPEDTQPSHMKMISKEQLNPKSLRTFLSSYKTTWGLLGANLSNEDRQLSNYSLTSEHSTDSNNSILSNHSESATGRLDSLLTEFEVSAGQRAKIIIKALPEWHKAASAYDFVKCATAQAFLTQAVYNVECENFVLSKKIEPCQ